MRFGNWHGNFLLAELPAGGRLDNSWAISKMVSDQKEAEGAVLRVWIDENGSLKAK